MSPLNGPLELGIRALTLLAEAYPQTYDLNRLVLLDHFILHSADVGGPESLHPEVPARVGELGIKRQLLRDGVDVMTRTGLVEMQVDDDGIYFSAGDGAEGFVGLLESAYSSALRQRARWVVNAFGTSDEDELRETMRSVFSAWDEEFHSPHASGSED